MDEAIHHYRQAIRFNPGLSQAWNNLGNLLARLGQLEEAIQHYEKALEIKNDYAFAHIGLAGALRAKGDLRRALDHFRQADRLLPNHPLVLSGMAWILATHSDEKSSAARECNPSSPAGSQADPTARPYSPRYSGGGDGSCRSI